MRVARVMVTVMRVAGDKEAMAMAARAMATSSLYIAPSTSVVRWAFLAFPSLQ